MIVVKVIDLRNLVTKIAVRKRKNKQFHESDKPRNL